MTFRLFFLYIVQSLKKTYNIDVHKRAETTFARLYLKQAIAGEQAVWIEYSVPGRNVTKRQIEPYQTYEENEQVYVIAYCHLRKRERKFRLDRLRLPDSSN